MLKKKLLMPLVAALVAGCLLLAACGGEPQRDAARVVVPDGSTAVAVASLMAGDGEYAGRSTAFEIVDGPEKIKEAVGGGKYDIAVVPANLAAMLYNKGADAVFSGVAVRSNLFIVGKTPLAGGLNGLTGKRIASIGQAAVPSITLRYLLNANKIAFEETVDSADAKEGVATLRYAASGPDAIKLLAQGSVEYALLAEPAVTQAVTKQGATVVLNLQEEWWKIEGNSENGFPQAVFVVRRAFYEQNADYVNAFLKAAEANPAWLSAHADAVGAAIGKHGSAFAGLDYTPEVLTRLNAVYSGGDAAKAEMQGYLNFLNALNPALIGGKLPDEAFYL